MLAIAQALQAGQLAVETGEILQARSLFRAAVEMQPQLAASWVMLGNVNFRNLIEHCHFGPEKGCSAAAAKAGQGQEFLMGAPGLLAYSMALKMDPTSKVLQAHVKRYSKYVDCRRFSYQGCHMFS